MRKLKRYITYLAYAVIALFVLILSISNHTPVTVDLFPLPYTLETPVFFLGLICFCVGLVTGGLFFSYTALRYRRLLKKESKRAAALHNELSALRAEATSNAHIQLLNKKAG